MKYLLGVIFLFFSFWNSAFSQLNLTIKLNKNLDSSKIKFFYLDGNVNKFLKPKFVNSTAVINETIKSRYARLIVNYPDKFGRMLGLCFLVTKGISSLQFDEVVYSEINKIAKYKVKNVINVENPSIYNEINKYTKNELKNFYKISSDNSRHSTDSSLVLQYKYYKILALKQIEFIKLNTKNYFYFEKFINEIVPSLIDNYLLELYEIFNTIFPDSFKESYEGECVKTLLEGNLFVKVGMQSPPFNVKDYLGKEVSSETFKGQYYLLSFWATWCSPCVKEIPQLINIRNTYDESKLHIISISCDTDSAKFISGIANYKMNWVHVFNSNSMKYLFGQKPIPSLYLIDKNGKIVFSSWEKPLKELDAILKNELSN